MPTSALSKRHEIRHNRVHAFIDCGVKRRDEEGKSSSVCLKAKVEMSKEGSLRQFLNGEWDRITSQTIEHPGWRAELFEDCVGVAESQAWNIVGHSMGRILRECSKSGGGDR
jgi:hypothetical protein